MAVEIEGLEFQIEAKSDNGSKGVKNLAQSFQKLKSAIKDNAGLDKAVEQLSKLEEITSKMGNIDKFEKLSNALSGLKDTKISSTLSKQLDGINSSISAIKESDIEKLERLTTALQELSSVGKINIPNVSKVTQTVNDTTNSADTGTDGAYDSGVEQANSYTVAADNATAATGRFKSILSGIGGVFSKAFSVNSTKLGSLATGLTNVGTAAKRAFVQIKAFASSIGSKLAAKVKQTTAGLGQFLASIKRIAMYRLIRSVMSGLVNAMKEGISNLYQYSKLFSGTFANSLDTVATSFQYLKNSAAAMVAPLINALAPAIDFIIDKVVALFNVINQLFAKLTGSSTYTAAKKVATAYADAADDASGTASDAADELKKSILGFDEINALTDNSTSSSSSGSGSDSGTDYSSMFEEVDISSSINDFAEQLMEAFENGDWEELGTLIGDKINEAIDNVNWSGIGTTIGYGINGAVQTAYYILDTVDFNNLGQHIADMLNNALEQIDFEFVGRLIVKPFTSLLDLIIGFLGGLDWGLIATSLSDFISGAFDEWSDWFDSYDWDSIGSGLYENVKDFITNMDWEGIAQSFWDAFNGALEMVSGIFEGWDDSLSEDVESKFDRITLYVSGAELALGAILALSGANIPLGIALLASGALGIATAVSLNWDSVNSSVSEKLSLIETAVGAATLAIGAILALSGANIPLGIALMAVGAASLVSAVGLNWDSLSNSVSGTVATIGAVVGGALLGLGAVLAFSGASIPLGIALMASGATTLISSVGLNWEGLSTEVKGSIAIVTAAVSTASLAIGAVLAFSGVSIPLGIALMAAGAVGLATLGTLNWDSLSSEVKTTVTEILVIVGAASLAIGAVLAFSGVALPMGIALMVAGAASLATAVSLNWDTLTNQLKSVATEILVIAGSAALAIGLILACTGVALPLGIALMAAGAASLVTAAALNWNSITESISGVLDNISQTFSNWADNFSCAVEIGVGLIKKGWTTLTTWVGDIADKAVGLVKSGWSSLTNWVGEVGDKAVSLAKSGWTTISNFVGDIGSKAFSLAKSGWSTISDFVGNIGSKAFSLAKSGWSTISSYVGDIGSKAFSLAKSGWSTVSAYVGNIGSKAFSLAKSGWSTVSAYVGNIGSKAFSLAKSGWSTVSAYVGNIGSKAFSLAKSGWSTVSAYVGNIGSKSFSLAKSGWSTISSYVGNIGSKAVSLSKSGWTSISSWVGSVSARAISLTKSGWTSISSWIGTKVSVGISLFKSGWSSIKSFFGLSSGGIIGANGGVKIFAAEGGVLHDSTSLWESIPKYGSGTENAHGTMFVAGEAGPEVVGHVNGRTEVLNKSQIASAIYTATSQAMMQYTSYWDAISQTVALCTSAVIQAMPDLSTMVFPSTSNNTSGASSWAADLASDTVSDTYGGDTATEISTGIREGLYEANARQNDLLREQNELLKQILEKDTTVEVTTNSFTKALNRKNQRDGKTVVPVSV